MTRLLVRKKMHIINKMPAREWGIKLKYKNDINSWHLPRTAYRFGPDGPDIELKWPAGICNDIPIDMRDNEVRCFSGDNDSISTNGQEDRCCCWNFGWYGSSIRIFPQRLKNRAIAPTHNISTATTMRTSSVRTIIFGPPASNRFKHERSQSYGREFNENSVQINRNRQHHIVLNTYHRYLYHL